jgi:hypothetical protein
MSECLIVFADDDCIVAVQDTGSSANGPAATSPAAAPKPGPAATSPAPALAPKPGPVVAAPAPKPGPAPAAAALVNIYKGRLRSSFKKPIRYR